MNQDWVQESILANATFFLVGGSIFLGILKFKKMFWIEDDEQGIFIKKKVKDNDRLSEIFFL